MKHSLKRLLKAGWTNFRRNSYMSFAVTGVMALALILILGIMSFQFLTSRVVSSIEGKVDISAYFKTDTEEADIRVVQENLEKLPEVRSVSYISREQAQEDFKARHADNPLIQESLTQLDDNPFEATLNIKAVDPTRYEGIATFLENSEYRGSMSKINYNENRAVIDKINRFAGALRNWGFITTTVIAIIAILIAFNTVRLTIYNQKQEIEIMRLVGASNWQIRGPYVAEGSFYGVFAAIIALAVFYPVLYFVSGKLETFIPEVNLFSYFLQNSWQVVIIALAAGMLMGMLSSVIAIRKHLKI